MKTKVRPSTGVITVAINTSEGERTVSTGTKDPALAREIIKSTNLRAVEVAAKAGALTHQLIQKLVCGRKMTLSGAIDEWFEWLSSVSSSERTCFCHHAYVKKWARDSRVIGLAPSELKEAHISRWINADDGNKLSSKRAMLAAVRSFVNYCSVKGYVMGDPSRLVRIKAHLLSHQQKEPRHKVCFTEEEFEKVHDYLLGLINDLLGMEQTAAVRSRLSTAKFWFCAIGIGRYAGLRMGDICTLEWSSLKEKGKLIVWTDKRDRRVELPIDRRLAVALNSIPPNSRRFCFPEQERVSRDPSKRCKLSVQFMRVLERAGVTGHSFHDLRHTYATDGKARGIPTPEISERLGHSNINATAAYLH